MRFLAVSLLCLLLPISFAAEESRSDISDDDVLGILQYVYYWYLDHDDVSQLGADATIDVYLSPIAVDRDPGDNTVFTRMRVPALDLEITIKKAHYTVAEMAREVRHAGPKIAAIHRNPIELNPERESAPRSFAAKEVLASFHERRHQPARPDPELRRRLKQALGEIVGSEGGAESGESQSFYVGPISAYSNDLWIYWLQQKKLILFSSDLSLGDALYWKHLPLYTRIFDLDSGVVTSLGEAPGTTAYVTKGWASRILFNTLVDGIEIQAGASVQ